jgi:hypothetical protein
MARIAHRSCSGPPETLSPPFSPLCPWIHGIFLAIEFAVAPSSTLPNSGVPGATLACASLNSGGLTTAERSSAARSRLFPRSDPLHPIQIERPRPRVPLRARAPNALARLSVPFTAAHHSRSDFPRLILIERLGPPLDPPPSDLDRTTRTSSDPSDPCSRPFPPGTGLARSARSPPSVADTPCPACQRSPAPARPRPQI